MLKKRFTFQELVLICCVLVLTAALGAAIGSGNANEKAYSARCRANLRAWSKTVKIYADSNDGFFIPQNLKSTRGNKFVIWSDYDSPLRRLVAPSVSKNIWKQGNSVNGCPAAPAKIRYMSYAHNSSVMGSIHINATDAKRLTALPNAEKYVLFGDSMNYNFLYSTYPTDSADKRIGLHHNNGNAAQLVFLDGRIEVLTRDMATSKAPIEIRRKFSPYLDGITEW